MRTLLALYICLAAQAWSQRIYIGVVGGTGITSNFPAVDISYPADNFGNPASRFQHLNGSRSRIGGALIEVGITEGFSIEANVLRRPMNAVVNFSEVPAGAPSRVFSDEFTAVKAWEFPVMLKYSLPWRRVRPFLAAGPSFRSQQDVSATQPSRLGAAAGFGVAAQWGKFRIAPELRYT